MKRKVLIVIMVFAVALSFSSHSQDQVEEKEYIIGATDIEIIAPKKVSYTYESDLFENEIIRVEYSGEDKSFRAFRNAREIDIRDKIFCDLNFSPYGFDLKEYYFHRGTDASPSKCQVLYFQVIEHNLIVAGNYQMCEKEAPRLRLQSDTEHPLDKLLVVYDGSVSDEIHPEGFWNEITGKDDR